MTRRLALEVLVRHAAENAADPGRGVRAGVSDGRRREVAEAVLRLWPLFRDYPPSSNDFTNLGLPVPDGVR